MTGGEVCGTPITTVTHHLDDALLGEECVTERALPDPYSPIKSGLKFAVVQHSPASCDCRCPLADLLASDRTHLLLS